MPMSTEEHFKISNAFSELRFPWKKMIPTISIPKFMVLYQKLRKFDLL